MTPEEVYALIVAYITDNGGSLPYADVKAHFGAQLNDAVMQIMRANLTWSLPYVQGSGYVNTVAV